MQTVTLTNPVTNYKKATSLTNLAVSLWFPDAKAKIDAGDDAERKAKWAKLKPFEMNVVTPPVGEGKYYLVDRPAALMLAHITVPMLKWNDFFAWLNEKYPPEAAPNSAIAEILEKGTSVERVDAAIKDDTTFTSQIVVWKAVDENKDDILLVTGSGVEESSLVDRIKSEVFHGWQFQSGTYTYDEDLGDGKPAYYTGKLVLKDAAFTGDSLEKTLYVVNLSQFQPDDNAGV